MSKSIKKAQKTVVHPYKITGDYFVILTKKSNKKLRGMETKSTEVKN